jgi:lipopolysaccharide assembly outer membrane protein LptD (OstA)
MLRGDVTVTTDTVVIHADEVDFHPDTNEAELRGNVRVQLASSPTHIITKL